MAKELTVKCPICTEHIDVLRDNEGTILFDNKFYHYDCYLNTKRIIKKCKCSKKNIIYTGEKLNDVLLYDGSFYYKDKFLPMINEKKKITQKWQYALENVNTFVEEANLKLDTLYQERIKKSEIEEKQTNAQRRFMEIAYESKVNQFIRETYNVPTVSSRIWSRLKAIYTGEYQTKQVIPPYHLLDMWKRQMGYLVRVKQKNITLGKQLDNESQVLYDLAILYSLYGSYLKFLEKQKLKNNTIDHDEIVKEMSNANAVYKKEDTSAKDINEEFGDLLI